jgi:hypothetical protein
VQKKINSAFKVLFRLLLIAAALAVGFIAFGFVGAWLFFSGDMRLNKIPSPSYKKDAYGYFTPDPDYQNTNSYFLIKLRIF